MKKTVLLSLLLPILLAFCLIIPSFGYELIDFAPVEGGSALGFYGDLATINFDIDYVPLETGLKYQSQTNNISGLLKYQYDLISLSANDGLLLHVGASAFLNQNQSMSYGAFLGIESYITRFTSATFDIYPLVIGNYTTAPEVKFGMRMYL